MTIKTQTLLMVARLLVAAVLATAGVMGWSSRRALLAETEAQGLVIAGLLARSASFGAHVMSDVEHAIGEQMVVEATIAAHLVAMGEAAGVGAKEINRRLRQIADDTVLDPAALFMAVVRTLLRTTAGTAATPGDVLRRLDDDLSRDNDSCMFVTLFCGILHVRTGEIDYSNGGHDLPYHLHGGGLSPLEDLGAGALGIEATDVYPSARLRLGTEESLFLYTDGVTEAMDAAGEQFSDERLEALLRRTPAIGPRQLLRLVVDEVNRFSAGAPQADDITGLVLRYTGPASPTG